MEPLDSVQIFQGNKNKVLLMVSVLVALWHFVGTDEEKDFSYQEVEMWLFLFCFYENEQHYKTWEIVRNLHYFENIHQGHFLHLFQDRNCFLSLSAVLAKVVVR